MYRKRKLKTLRRPELTEDQILKWADAYHALTGKWPNNRAMPRAVIGAPAERWNAIDQALRGGHRGLPGGSSLMRLLAARRGRRNLGALPDFTVEHILKWCDDFHKHTGEWPKLTTFPHQCIPDSHRDTWSGVHGALSTGGRGLPGGSSLARLLAEHRGVRNVAALPALTVRQVLKWADEHHARTGLWPKENACPDEIPDSGGETWTNVIKAMRRGHRGFQRGTSLAALLTEQRGVRNHMLLPPLTVKQILAWADAFQSKTGKWPARDSSPQEIPGTFGELWVNVNQALSKGLRGLPSGSSLAELLAEQRGVRNTARLQHLTRKQILVWADAFRKTTDEWPTVRCSPQEIPGTRGECWRGMDNALRIGLRGLPGRSSLAKLLARHRGVPNRNTSMKERMAHRRR